MQKGNMNQPKQLSATCTLPIPIHDVDVGGCRYKLWSNGIAMVVDCVDKSREEILIRPVIRKSRREFPVIALLSLRGSNARKVIIPDSVQFLVPTCFCQCDYLVDLDLTPGSRLIPIRNTDQCDIYIPDSPILIGVERRSDFPSNPPPPTPQFTVTPRDTKTLKIDFKPQFNSKLTQTDPEPSQ
jgi:hypothetical protein